MHVNVTSVFALTQVLLPLLHKSSDPSIIYTSSGVGRHGRAFWGAYSVSKFATEGLSQIVADEHQHGPLRENRDTLKRPADILAPYIYLLGPDSAGVTGQSFDAQ